MNSKTITKRKKISQKLKYLFLLFSNHNITMTCLHSTSFKSSFTATIYYTFPIKTSTGFIDNFLKRLNLKKEVTFIVTK